MKSSGLFLCAAFVLSACASPSRNPDDVLAARIKQEIAQTQGIGGANSVKVQTHNGVVILSGFIDNAQQRNDAGQTALKVSGVQEVYNNLQVLRPTSSGQ